MQNYMELSKNYLYDVSHILPRRYGLKCARTFLYGAPGVGKSALALLHAKGYKHTFYVDCADCRVDIESVNTFILKLYLERHLELLIVDNYTPHIALPHLEHIILIHQSPALCPLDFTKKRISALSFEEYVSFDNKNLSINHLFNAFLKDGNLALLHIGSSHRKILRKQEILKLALANDFALFCAILPLQARIVSVHSIYSALKKTHKISKDRIYPLLHSLEEKGIIFFVPHIKERHKKIYFYDFTLPLCVQNDRHLGAILENMLLLELFSFCEKYDKSAVIHYGDDGELICALGVFIFLPFATRESIESKLARHKHTYPFIYVITFHFEGNGKIAAQSALMEWQAMSFINFALEFHI